MPHQASKLKPKQPDPRREWVLTKYQAFLDHQANKTTSQFFPALYEEFFSKWKPIPTEDELRDAQDNVAIATAKARKTQEHVRDFELHNYIGELITTITNRRSTV